MNLSAYFAEAVAVLLANRTRTLLTALGLIIGVTAVIAIQVLGAATSGAVSGILGEASERTFILIPNFQQADFSRAAIRLRDLQHAKDAVPNVIDAIPAGGQSLHAIAGHSAKRVTLGATPDERFATSTPLQYGRKISAADIASATSVCVLSDAAYAKFGLRGDPSGTSLRVGEHRYTIVGVLAKSRSGLLPITFNNDVAIPYTTYEAQYARGRSIFAARFLMNDASQVEATEAAAVAWAHSVKGARTQYVTYDRKSFTKAIDKIFSVLTIVVALIGAVSLLVAGIGILNIMLVSVAERTHEIGLRKAIGATRLQVLLQFFIEALALSGFGCLVGLLLGLGLGAAVDNLFIVAISGSVPAIPWVQSSLIAVSFASLVTLAFGTYPAWRAANLDPIEALRYE